MCKTLRLGIRFTVMKSNFIWYQILPHLDNFQYETLLSIVHSQELDDHYVAMQLGMVLDVISSLNSACPHLCRHQITIATTINN